ncbi:transcriptional regulator, MarR family [Methylocaldum marinum]|uniref:Transcriptional regulator, MarR family n=1 Tax=Methylocaldum marinum TaxID=1432792 RepID=A0A250KNG5_9GAMM|nr:MarR family winged helix-turn-helix transcriptional regulator [Methylocaldum marinum]BBA33072.1 transcriptional regulator, MarR family [Methylocaldum marinum]
MPAGSLSADLSELMQCTCCACFNLRKASRAVTQLYDDTLRPAGIRVTQFSLLVAASLAGPTTVSRLAEIAVMDRTTLTRNLEILEKLDLIEIAPGKDRRTRVVDITGKGQEALSKALPLWKEAQSRVVNALGESRWRTLQEHLSRVVAVADPDKAVLE